MTYSDLNGAARLHREALPDTVSSKIGTVYLQNLYERLLLVRPLHICLVAEEKGVIIGGITATSDLKKTQQFLNPLRLPHLIFLITLSLLRGNISITQLLKKLYFEYQLKKFNPLYPTILTLFVDERHRKKGVGKNLVSKLVKWHKRYGGKYLYVDTENTNLTALSFYKKFGFRIYANLLDSFILRLNY